MANEWWQRSKPEELKAEPWLHIEVTRYLESLLRPEMSVLEHGAGGSTLWFASRVKKVFSIESDQEWFMTVLKMAPKNVDLMCSEHMPKSMLGTYDLMLVDGDPVANRAEYLDQAEKLVRRGGWVVLDNANRPEYAMNREMMRRRCQFWVQMHFHHPIVRYMETEFYRLRGGMQE